MRKLTTAALAAFLVIAPASTPAMAADTDIGTVEQQDEDDGFPWGLLGLLGLAGLLGLKKDDHDRHTTTNRTDGRL